MLSSISSAPRSESSDRQKPEGLTINTAITPTGVRPALQTANSYASVEWMPHISQYPNPHRLSPPSSSTHNIFSNSVLIEIRSIEDLRSERLYLLNALRSENEKATNLLARIPPLEGGLAQDGISQVRRKMRKRLGWLRHRLNETNRQQQAVLSQLNQLNDQISAVERSNKAELEKRQYQQLHENAMAAMCLLHLDPTTPEFQPEGYPFPRVSSSIVKDCPSESSVPNVSSTAACENIFPRTEAMKYPTDELSTIHGNFENYRFTHRPSSSFDSTTFKTLFSETRPERAMRRQSLPDIPGLSDISALTKKEEDLEEEGVGKVTGDRKRD